MTELLGNKNYLGEVALIEPGSVVPEDLAHPVRILMEEHAILINHAEQASKIAASLKNAKIIDYGQVDNEIGELRHIAEHLLKSENHYQREENVLFPYLEKHGITGPPAAMWIEHETIRKTKSNFHTLVYNFKTLAINDFINQATEVTNYLATTLSAHYYKENNVLFQMALKVITAEEWNAIREEFDELGFCCFTPEPLKSKSGESDTGLAGGQTRSAIDFEYGGLLPGEIEAMLNTLPIEITFIDSDDRVRYLNRPKERLFIRTKAVLGRTVQQCHPQKSVHLVNQILDDFKNGKRDVAEFWINFKDRFVHIRFFPVRDQDGNYLGCIETVQDITDIKKIEGEKRLL